MKFLDIYAGIGGFRLGMEMAGHECVGHIEIDKFANKSYEAMHKPKESEFIAKNIRTVEPRDLPDADCYCFGFPCQAFSIAGKRGGYEDTRGSLFFEVMRLAAVRKPKYLFAENVKGLLSHNGGKTFGTILNTLGELGYWFEYQVLNSKDFGVPQNRERVFIVGHFGKVGGRKVFPIGYSNTKVNELQRQQNITNCLTARYRAEGTGSYVIEREQYAQIKQIGNIDQHKRIRKNPSTGRVYSTEGISPCLSTMQGGGLEPKILCKEDKRGVMITEATKKGYNIAHEGDSINLAVPGSKTRRGRVGKGVANTLDTSCDQGILTRDRMRRLTPKECFRLQGFPDEYFERAAQVNSDSQLYKQAGNSVTVNVVYEIAKRL